MKKSQIIRAWRDEEYYRSLSEAERAQVPANPAGLPAVEDEVLASIAGGCHCLGTVSSMCTPCPPSECSC